MKAAKLTAATITDWQIREFEIDELRRRRSSVKRWAAVDLATQALDSADPVTGVRSAAAIAARARCAEILNARTKECK